MDDKESPYITSWGLVPPSPTRDDLDHSPFDAAFAVPDPALASPSYNGSYYNSPFSQHSDLVDLDFLHDPAPSAPHDYEPSEYDAPSHPGSLLMFPPDPDYIARSPFDHASPASSQGDDAKRHSRASSSASNNPSPSPQHPAAHSPQPTFQPSPRLDVLSSFGNMSVRTPNWPQQPLPAAPSPSPPRLALPPGITFGSEPTAVPKIVAPACKEEDGMMFSIVPATPVGGPDPGVRQHTPFQPSLFPDSTSIRQERQPENWQDTAFIDNQLGSSDPPFGLQQQPRPPRNIDEQHRQQLQSFTFGGGSTPADPIRRTVSDSLSAPRFHRQSRSEEIRPIPTSTNPYHAQSNSIGGTGPHFLFPPSSHADFIQRQQQGQFLHPNDVPSSTSTTLQPQGLSSGLGHMRRASSGSRSGRGAEVWGTQADHSPHSNTLGVRRMSPYPTPSASPRVNYTELDELNDLGMGNGMGGGIGLGLGVGVSTGGVDGIPGIGEPPVSAGYSEEVSITGRNAYGRDNASSQGVHRAESVTSLNATAAADGISQGPVTKQNVTTGRTANASIKRRKQEANFECPVPGCGSTFTRGFNLKGHMRSHYEQKPYKCHWPGCDKGFARQHDCKRHEQLHSNYRPFVCDGCGKNFARMDALNRHLRSEAGAECAKVAEDKKDGQEMEDDVGDEQKPAILERGSSPSRSRRRSESGNPGGGGMLGLPDNMWGVAV